MQLLVLLFILSHITMVTAVAGCHRDRDKDHRSRENCTAAGFSDIPAGIEPSTKVLLFTNNLFSTLSWSSFNVFTEIHEIDLEGNKIPEVTPSSSTILPTLSVLRLRSNRLTQLSDRSFTACPALTELYLDHNTIESLSDHSFTGLSKLEILDLSSNRIAVLPDLMLHPLPAIETLILEENKIKVMPDDWFSQKEEVPYLYLSANPWVCSCSLGYFRRYLDDYEQNVYVRDGPIITMNPDSVVCDAPPQYKNKPLMSLEESDLCSPPASGPAGDFDLAAPPKTAPPSAAPPETTPPTTPAAPHPNPMTTAPPTTPAPRPMTTAPPKTAPPRTAPLTTAPPMTAPPETTPAAPRPRPMTTAPPPTTQTPMFAELFTLGRRSTTWSYQSLTSFTSWVVDASSAVEVQTSSSRLTLPTIRPSVETTAPTRPTTTTRLTASPVASTPPAALQEVATAATVTRRAGHGGVRGGGVFCLWLFAGCFLLCLASAACSVATLAKLVTWYRTLYQPLRATVARRRGGAEGVALLTFSRKEEEVAGGGVMALYRSVLFINREEGGEGGGATAGDDGGKGGEEGGGKGEVTLEPIGGGGAREERGVYRKTMYRLVSREEELEGWKEVMEECRVERRGGAGGAERGTGAGAGTGAGGGAGAGTGAGGAERGTGGAERGTGAGAEQGTGAEGAGGAGGAGGTGGTGGGAGGAGAGGGSGKRFSVILREEREEAGGGREELDWVVGRWEVEQRSSWGEWLAPYLPRMPWGVTTPPGGESTL